MYLLVCLALRAPVSFAEGDAPQIATPQAQRTAQQQAVLSGEQATEQVLRRAQQSSYQFNPQMIQGSSAQMNYENLCCFLTESPKFSVKPGKYNEPRTVKIADSTAGATIYYTTDGWTPPAESQRHTGPIKVSSTTMLRAIAISPRTGRSFVTAGKYAIGPPGTARIRMLRLPLDPLARTRRPRKSCPPAGHNGASRLRFPCDSEDRRSGRQNRVDSRSGSSSRRRRSCAQRLARHRTGRASGQARFGGMPGQVNFHVDALNVHGTVIKLRRAAAIEGQDKPPGATVLIPVVGQLALFGTDAVIARGTPLDATVDTDTVLVASK